MVLGPGATLIRYKNFKFVITHMPHASNMIPFVEDLEQYNTSILLRVCSGHYELSRLNIARIPVLEMKYPDGSFPNKEVISNWIYIVKHHFENNPGTAIAVNCKFGLGRSAVLVAIALMESGLPGKDAIGLIRNKRKGTFNKYQYGRILGYKSKNRLVTAANAILLDEEPSTSTSSTSSY